MLLQDVVTGWIDNARDRVVQQLRIQADAFTATCQTSSFIEWNTTMDDIDIMCTPSTSYLKTASIKRIFVGNMSPLLVLHTLFDPVLELQSLLHACENSPCSWRRITLSNVVVMDSLITVCIEFQNSTKEKTDETSVQSSDMECSQTCIVPQPLEVDVDTLLVHLAALQVSTNTSYECKKRRSHRTSGKIALKRTCRESVQAVEHCTSQFTR